MSQELLLIMLLQICFWGCNPKCQLIQNPAKTCAKSPELPRGYGERLAVRGENWLHLVFFPRLRAFGIPFSP